VESSCECGYEPSGGIGCWETTYQVSAQLVASRAVLCSIELVSPCDIHRSELQEGCTKVRDNRRYSRQAL
jgi:hypothetical protein